MLLLLEISLVWNALVNTYAGTALNRYRRDRRDNITSISDEPDVSARTISRIHCAQPAETAAMATA